MGNSGAARYVRNPQLRLAVGGDAPVDVLLFLEQHDDRLEDGAADGDRAIGFSVYKNGGRRLARLARPFVKSGSFSYARSVLVEASLPPGAYTLIPCTFEPDQEADLSVRAHCRRDAGATLELSEL